MTGVTIALPPRPYDAIIEDGLLRRAGEKLAELFGVAKIFAGKLVASVFLW